MTLHASVSARSETAKGFRVPKPGETTDDCQDFYCLDTARRRYALSDGVGQSMLPGEWAQLLVAHACTEGFPRDKDNVADWVLPVRARWEELRRTIIERHPERYWLHSDPNPVGAATLCALQLKDGKRYEIFAIGDSCLFIVRRDAILLSLPLQDAAAFDTRPHSLTTVDDVPDGCHFHSGDYEDGDLFLLASDALAKWTLAEARAGRFPWRDLSAIGDQQALVDLVRQELSAGRLGLDDVALLVIETTPTTASRAFAAPRQKDVQTMYRQPDDRPTPQPAAAKTLVPGPSPADASAVPSFRHFLATVIVSLVVSLVGTTTALRILLPDMVTATMTKSQKASNTVPAPTVRPAIAPVNTTAIAAATLLPVSSGSTAATPLANAQVVVPAASISTAAAATHRPDKSRGTAPTVTRKPNAIKAQGRSASTTPPPAPSPRTTQSRDTATPTAVSATTAPTTTHDPTPPPESGGDAQKLSPASQTTKVWVSCETVCKIDGSMLILASATPYRSHADASSAVDGQLSAGRYEVTDNRSARGWVEVKNITTPPK